MLADFPWQRFSRFIDIGGATGSLLAALLRRHPNSTGALFDLPQVRLRNADRAVKCKAFWLETFGRCRCRTARRLPAAVQVVKRAEAVWRQQHAQLLLRVEFASGSFFDEGLF